MGDLSTQVTVDITGLLGSFTNAQKFEAEFVKAVQSVVGSAIQAIGEPEITLSAGLDVGKVDTSKVQASFKKAYDALSEELIKKDGGGKLSDTMKRRMVSLQNLLGHHLEKMQTAESVKFTKHTRDMYSGVLAGTIDFGSLSKSSKATLQKYRAHIEGHNKHLESIQREAEKLVQRPPVEIAAPREGQQEPLHIPPTPVLLPQLADTVRQNKEKMRRFDALVKKVEMPGARYLRDTTAKELEALQTPGAPLNFPVVERTLNKEIAARFKRVEKSATEKEAAEHFEAIDFLSGQKTEVSRRKREIRGSTLGTSLGEKQEAAARASEQAQGFLKGRGLAELTAAEQKVMETFLRTAVSRSRTFAEKAYGTDLESEAEKGFLQVRVAQAKAMREFRKLRGQAPEDQFQAKREKLEKETQALQKLQGRTDVLTAPAAEVKALKAQMAATVAAARDRMKFTRGTEEAATAEAQYNQALHQQEQLLEQLTSRTRRLAQERSASTLSRAQAQARPLAVPGLSADERQQQVAKDLAARAVSDARRFLQTARGTAEEAEAEARLNAALEHRVALTQRLNALAKKDPAREKLRQLTEEERRVQALQDRVAGTKAAPRDLLEMKRRLASLRGMADAYVSLTRNTDQAAAAEEVYDRVIRRQADFDDEIAARKAAGLSRLKRAEALREAGVAKQAIEKTDFGDEGQRRAAAYVTAQATAKAKAYRSAAFSANEQAEAEQHLTKMMAQEATVAERLRQARKGPEEPPVVRKLQELSQARAQLDKLRGQVDVGTATPGSLRALAEQQRRTVQLARAVAQELQGTKAAASAHALYVHELEREAALKVKLAQRTRSDADARRREAKDVKEAARLQEHLVEAQAQAAQYQRGKAALTAAGGHHGILQLDPADYRDVQAFLKKRRENLQKEIDAADRRAMRVPTAQAAGGPPGGPPAPPPPPPPRGGGGGWPPDPDLHRKRAEIASIDQSLTKLNREMKGNVGLWHQMEMAGRAFLRYAIGYGAGFAALGKALQLGRDVVQFQDDMKQLQAITQATDDEMVSLAKSIEMVATSPGNSLQEIVKIAQLLGQAGVAIQDIPAAAQATTAFTKATGSAPDIAAEVITSAKGVFSEETYTSIADQLTRAVNISKLTAEDLKILMNLNAQTAKSVHMTLSQMLASAAVLRNLGIAGSTTATGSRVLFRKLFNPDEKLATYLQSRYAANQEFMGKEVIRAKYQAFQTERNPEVAVLNEMRRIGVAGEGRSAFKGVLEQRAENVFLPLIDSIEQLSVAAGKISGTGAAAEGAAKKSESLSQAMVRLGASIESVAVESTTGLVAALTKVADFSTDFLKRITRGVEKAESEGQVGGLPAAAATSVGVAAAVRTPAGLLGKAAAGVTAGLTAGLQSPLLRSFTELPGWVSSLLDTMLTLGGITAILRGKARKSGVDAAKMSQAATGAASAVSTVADASIAVQGLSGLATRIPAATRALLSGVARLGAGGWIGLAVTGLSLLAEAVGLFSEGGKAQIEALRRRATEARSAATRDAEAFATYKPDTEGGLVDRSKELQQAVTESQTAIRQVLGQDTTELERLVAKLGTTAQEVGTKPYQEVTAQIQQLAGRTISPAQFAKLSKAGADLESAKGELYGMAQQVVERARTLLDESTEELDKRPEAKAFLAAYRKRETNPLLSRKPETREDTQQLQEFLNGFYADIREAETGLLAEEAKNLQKLLIEAEASQPLDDTDISKMLADINLAIANGMTDRLEAWRDVLQKRMQQQQVKLQRAQVETKAWKPAHVVEERVQKGVGQTETLLGRVEAGLKDAAALTAAKKTAEAERKTAEEEQAKALETAPIEIQRREEELEERSLRLKEASLTEQEDTYRLSRKIKEATEQKQYRVLLEEGGLLEQKFAVEKERLKVAEELLELELRKKARAAGVGELPTNLAEMPREQRRRLASEETLRTTYQAYDTAKVKVDTLDDLERETRTTVQKEAREHAMSRMKAVAELRKDKATAELQRQGKEPMPDYGKMRAALQEVAASLEVQARLNRETSLLEGDTEQMANERYALERERNEELVRRLELEKGANRKVAETDKKLQTQKGLLEKINTRLAEAEQKYKEAIDKLNEARGKQRDSSQFWQNLQNQISGKTVTPKKQVEQLLKEATQHLKEKAFDEADAKAKEVGELIRQSLGEPDGIDAFDASSLAKSAEKISRESQKKNVQDATDKADLARSRYQNLQQQATETEQVILNLDKKLKDLGKVTATFDPAQVNAAATTMLRQLQSKLDATPLTLQVKTPEMPPSPEGRAPTGAAPENVAPGTPPPPAVRAPTGAAPAPSFAPSAGAPAYPPVRYGDMTPVEPMAPEDRYYRGESTAGTPTYSQTREVPTPEITTPLSEDFFQWWEKNPRIPPPVEPIRVSNPGAENSLRGLPSTAPRITEALFQDVPPAEMPLLRGKDLATAAGEAEPQSLVNIHLNGQTLEARAAADPVRSFAAAVRREDLKRRGSVR